MRYATFNGTLTLRLLCSGNAIRFSLFALVRLHVIQLILLFLVILLKARREECARVLVGTRARLVPACSAQLSSALPYNHQRTNRERATTTKTLYWFLNFDLKHGKDINIFR